MSAVRPHRWTRVEVDRLVDERPGLTPRYELVDGELLVTPAPSRRHQRIILHLALLLQPYLVQHRMGEIVLGPGELELDGEERYEPDLMIVPAVDGKLPPADTAPSHAILVCEVLSPGSLRHDRVTKRKAFQRHAVPEYWIVDPDAEVFEVWRVHDERPAVVDGVLTWQPKDVQMAFELDVQVFFAAVADGAPLE
ncbi:MAG TPA: Uma2 family endonuclease [Gemmatimonadaceae bacterium]|nr:Uma2 family endonuclease [Gemmatimonadaceae bacterium]